MMSQGIRVIPVTGRGRERRARTPRRFGRATEASPPAWTGMETNVTIHQIPVQRLSGEDTTLAEHAGKALLIVNVASQCGLTPPYKGLEPLPERLAGRGFAVLGFPCNQFGGQEPGTAEEIAEFCSTTYGVTFPMYAKIEVNGDGRHPLYDELTAVADGKGEAGDIMWNFEKFLVSPDGVIVSRFRPRTTPEDPDLLAAIEDV